MLKNPQNDACTKLQAGVRYKSEARIDEAVRFVDMCISLLANNQIVFLVPARSKQEISALSFQILAKLISL